MKTLLITAALLFTLSFTSFAQDSKPGDGSYTFYLKTAKDSSTLKQVLVTIDLGNVTVTNKVENTNSIITGYLWQDTTTQKWYIMPSDISSPEVKTYYVCTDKIPELDIQKLFIWVCE